MQKKRASNIEVKKINRNHIYRYILQHERVSKPDISAALGISMPTVMQNVNELREAGLIEEVGAFGSTGGRKAAALAPLVCARYAAGVDITQNHIGMVFTNLAGEVLDHSRVYRPYEDTEQYYQELGQLVDLFVKKQQTAAEQFLGVGISIPGIVKQDEEWIDSSYVLGIDGTPCQVFSQYIPYPSVFINDANAAALAEAHLLAEEENAVYLSLSNSVGGAVISNRIPASGGVYHMNQLYVGDNWKSGEFGHMTLYPGGRKCYCGKHGCMDAYCSAKVLWELADGTLEGFFKGMSDQPRWKAVWDQYLEDLSMVVNNLRMIFDCKIIIGGYVGSYIEPYLFEVRRRAGKRNTFESSALFIQGCRYRVEASALGAAFLQVGAFVGAV